MRTPSFFTVNYHVKVRIIALKFASHIEGHNLFKIKKIRLKVTLNEWFLTGKI